MLLFKDLFQRKADVARSSVETIAADQLDVGVDVVQVRAEAGAPRQRRDGRQTVQVPIAVEFLDDFDDGLWCWSRDCGCGCGCGWNWAWGWGWGWSWGHRRALRSALMVKNKNCWKFLTMLIPGLIKANQFYICGTLANSIHVYSKD